VAVVGRANVGKSTLVNRLLRRRAAIEHPEPGVTRDRQGYEVQWNGESFTIVDTGGWEPRAKGLTAKVRAQAERAAAEADVILFVVDAETGATTDDLAVARGLRRATVPVILVANKVDSAAGESDATELARMGFGEPVPVSALHGRGSGDLLDIVVEHLRAADSPRARATGDDDTLSIAIVGRPNVGKSSLFNRLVGDDRSIVHDLPGTTRDTVDTVLEHEGKRYRFIDTAGMRRRAKEAKGPEYFGLVRSMRAIEEADVALLVVDAQEGPAEQDQKIARIVADAGNAAIVVLNKWDRVDTDDVYDVAADVADVLRFVWWAPLIRTAALTGRGINKILPAVETARASWETRVPTSALNSWLRETIGELPLGSTARARPTRVRYVTQVGARPPHFVFFTSGEVTASGLRALERRLRDRFGFEGTPLRLTVRRKQRDKTA
jgi:GTP-binding protein